MASHYLFDPDFCNVASGWEKGSSRRTFRTAGGGSGRMPRCGLVPSPNCGFWPAVGHSGRSCATPEYDLPLAEMLEQEQPHLMPMIVPFDGYVEIAGQGVEHLSGHL